MVHTRPDLPGRWARYQQMNRNQRMQLARAQHQNYDRRIVINRDRRIHPEQGMNVDEINNPRLREVTNFQGWGHFVNEPEPYDPELVQEFYAAMVPPAFGEWCTVVIRGVRVRLTMDDICRHYQVPRRADLDPTYGIPPVPNVAQDELYHPIIAANLRRNGRGQWIPKEDMIKKTELRPETAMWLRFIKSRLAPSTHYSTVDWYAGRVLYCLQNSMLLDIGYIIVLHMMDAAAERCRGILPFPSLITKICRDQGVWIGELIHPPAPLDRAAYAAHIRSVVRIEGRGGGGEAEDALLSDDEAIDVDYDPALDEEEEPEDPRVIARIDRMETHMHDHINRQMYYMSLLVQGHPVPDDAFPAPDDAGPSNPRPDEAGPSNPRPARQRRRRGNE